MAQADVVQIDAYVNERRVIERCLLTYLLLVALRAIETVKPDGLEIRPDFPHALDLEVQRIFEQMLQKKEQDVRIRVARRLERDAMSILDRSNLRDRPLATAVASCMMILKMIDEKVGGNPDSQVALVALAIMNEVENEGQYWSKATGTEPLAKEIYKRMKLLGYF
jgi:hypothetical protein